MGQNTVQAYGAKGRRDAIAFDPEDITLITDPNHPLYDPRILEEPNESFIANLEAVGQLEPIGVRRNGERDGKPLIECVFGRKRVQAFRILNERRKKKGLEPFWVYAMIKQGSDAEMLEVIISENEARVDDTPLTRAWKMKKLIDLGRDEDRVAVVFCCAVPTVKSTLALLDLAPAVQAAVGSDQISATVAVQAFAKTPREEQEGQLQQLVESGATKGAAAKEAVRQIQRGDKPELNGNGNGHRMRSRAFLEGFATELRKKKLSEAVAVVEFILGKDTVRLPSEVKQAAVEAGWKKKEKNA